MTTNAEIYTSSAAKRSCVSFAIVADRGVWKSTPPPSRTRRPRLFGAVIALLAAAVFLAGCQSSSDDKAVDIPGLSEFDAANYHRQVDGSLELFDRESLPAIEEEAWRALVLRQRSGGLTSLSSEERVELLVGAMRAYLYLVHDARFRYTSGEMTALAEETYQKEESTGLYLGFRKRHATYAGIQVEWGGSLLGLSGSLEEQTEILDESAGNHNAHRWSVRGGVVTCVELDSNAGGLGFLQTAYFQRYSTAANGRARKSSDLQGRDVEMVIASYPDGSEVTYWLDRISLFPVRWSEETTLPDGTKMALTADLLGINEELRMEAPAPECE